ncbi:PIN domain-containing protein [Halomonas sp. SpR1]|uniref:PIN domain-containing protein n=1 Tax=Halomonas sp. SpR1 TaxID=3050462 RepID=UPI0027E4BD46|nr:PIN domain-containing protein [Halomonas sp. SpR1]MDQ7731310.1 PIN domain-containing protein [Halomonas sp. SpR1]
MKAALDANVLMQLLGIIGNSLYCPRTKQEITNAEGRADALLERFSDPGFQLLIPAPAMAEVLVKVAPELQQAYIDFVNNTTSLSIIPFDTRSIIECARLFDAQEAKQLKKGGESKAKIAVDRQVVAIAISNGAKELWTHDKTVFKKASRVGLVAKSLADIEPIPAQKAMEFSES